ncbi:MAG: DUF5060 domain-containing protein [Bacteroidota bacterium]
MKNTTIKLFAIFMALNFLSCSQEKEKSLEEIEIWNVYEIALNGPSTGNPFMDVVLKADFVNEGTTISVPGFYDGSGVYRIRFSPDKTGTWTYKTHSNIRVLKGASGGFQCVAATGDNHGPLKVVNTYSLQYADSTSFYPVGTTAYQWTSVDQKIQEKTIETLKASPFNKMRMCVFPKWYIYGNETEPWQYPFRRENGENDLTRPNYAFFQNVDRRVKQLLDLGIQADVILFHPYDRDWGYFRMGDAMNKRYVHYMIARISAYRNVWWSLANEWDVPKIKEAIDWEGIGTLLKNEDPHQRLRGIHNWYNTEDHFYDHSRPWITHTSAQTAQFYNALRWRGQYQKPLLFDEMRYEGDVERGWGNLSAKEMTSYFWMAGLSGGYPTHGETIRNTSDQDTEVRWWAKGGILMGKSKERIGFFRKIMEELPAHEMWPALEVQGDSAHLNSNIHTFFKESECYLTYVADSARTLVLDLKGNTDYELQVLDTWNMKIMDTKTVKPGVYEYTTDFPYTALKAILKED